MGRGKRVEHQSKLLLQDGAGQTRTGLRSNKSVEWTLWHVHFLVAWHA